MLLTEYSYYIYDVNVFTIEILNEKYIYDISLKLYIKVLYYIYFYIYHINIIKIIYLL